ncbi:MAG TPA: rod shape-determining protein [Leptospiraceae bacterium]|nr:rod shape-determining protein [Leptospirales bacterium]HMU84148.1 rod shape-determining protein [Leptospiraceae bacterium]HMW60525.1 rod shape-determining protein [Leptospiraceae bacterium]HMX56537.1 rod shape-determining protein [Leptospiraceae bacterium]HNE21555.1 rod shape-determining protein [Leptospiraceae bacterium]
MMFDRVFSLFSNDMGIDLGTANTLVYVKGQGIVLSEPSVVAVQSSTGKVLAVGNEAKRMLGKTPGDIVAIRPMRDGVIADFETVEKMIRYFIQKVHKRTTFVKPRMVIGVPSGITEVEKRAVRESAEQAGAREIFLIEEALAAAIGADIPIHEPAGSMIVDIGGGTTEIAVISLGGMVISDSIRIGGDEFDEAIVRYLRTQYNLVIGDRTAEDVKITIGNAFPEKKTEVRELKGRDAISGLPRVLEIDSNEIRKALQEPIEQILEAVKSTLEKTPPELAADIVERGIVLAGGGCLLKGLDKYISKETGVPVFRAPNPLICVALGTGKYLDELKNINRGLK